MRKALVVGIDHYEHVGCLSGCVNDANAVRAVLERHADGTMNFATPRLLTASGPSSRVTRAGLKDAIRELFAGDSEIALFFFAGHGHLEETGGYVCTSDSRSGDDGVALSEIITMASNSTAQNKVIILDSCHSGIAATHPGMQGVAEIKEGMTILTASTAEQHAIETGRNRAGIFTNLLVDALNGSAANLVGDITPGSAYAHIDQSLGPWAQRPVFKTNVKSFVSLRKVIAPIELYMLRQLATLFPWPDYLFHLDPAYEPERFSEQLNDPRIPPPDPQKNAVFAILQQYAKVNLIRPVGAPHMWHAAMQSASCELTILGRHYRELVAKNLI